MTGYIAEMRKLVGCRTLIQCAASIICVDGQGLRIALLNAGCMVIRGKLRGVTLEALE